MLALGEEHPVALVDLPLVGVVERGQLDLLAGDVAPDVELGEVADREDAHVLARRVPAVVQVPQLGPLRAGIPLAEAVVEAEDPFLRARLVLVAAGPAEGGVDPLRPDQRRFATDAAWVWRAAQAVNAVWLAYRPATLAVQVAAAMTSAGLAAAFAIKAWWAEQGGRGTLLRAALASVGVLG